MYGQGRDPESLQPHMDVPSSVVFEGTTISQGHCPAGGQILGGLWSQSAEETFSVVVPTHVLSFHAASS